MAYLGASREEAPFLGHVRSVTFVDCMYLSDDATGHTPLWLEVHALGHLLLHAQPHHPFVCADLDHEAEQQADTFARLFLSVEE